jgi:prevent-host-death family protein
MKTIAAGKFKAQCLAVIDEVHDLKEEVVITKRGKPMAKLIPVKKQKDDIFGFMRGQGRIVGDIISPIDPTDKWDSEK